MERRIVTAALSPRGTVTRRLTQWDYGQTLTFTGADLPESYEVYFSNSKSLGSAKKQIGGADGVQIPDEYLTTGDDVFAWVFLHDGASDGETVYPIVIPVTRRPKPSEETPTPVQQDVITQAIAALQNEASKAEAFADDAKESADRAREETLTALAEAKASGEFDGKDGTDGRDGVDGKDGVSPEVWATEISGGHRLHIKDATGEDAFDVLDGMSDLQSAKAITALMVSVSMIDDNPGTVLMTDGSTAATASAIGTSDAYACKTGQTLTYTLSTQGGRLVFAVYDAAGNLTHGVEGNGYSAYITGEYTFSADDAYFRVSGVTAVNYRKKYAVSYSYELPNAATKADVSVLHESVESLDARVDALEEAGPSAGAVKSVNGKTGDVTLEASDVGALPDNYLPPVLSVNGKNGAVVLSAADIGAGTYSKPTSGIPASDLAPAVQASLGKADTALQSAPVQNVNGKVGAVTLTASDVGALPFFASGRIPLQAHKGLFSTLPTGGPPEESIGAFELAGKGGIRFCEADIRLTADGLPICLHDATLNRTTTGTGNANALTLAELRELRLKWPDGTVSEELIPTLDEYLYVCKKYGMIAVIELKEVRVAGFMDAVLAKINECGMMDQCILIQSVANIDRIRAVTDLPVLLITADSNWNDTYAYLQSDQCKLIGLTMDKSPNLTTDIPAKIAACHQLGIPCEVYTCNTKAEADAYFAMGADIVNTDILTESDWLGGAVDAAMSDSSENAVQNKIVKGYVDAADADLQEQINALGEPFRVKQFIVDPNETIPSVTQDVANKQIPKILLTITGQEATDYQIIGMISYEAFDATSGGNRLNFIPVCQFTGVGQTELSIRGCIMGPNSKTMRRFVCWVLLKRRQGDSA